MYTVLNANITHQVTVHLPKFNFTTSNVEIFHMRTMFIILPNLLIFRFTWQVLIYIVSRENPTPR